MRTGLTVVPAALLLAAGQLSPCVARDPTKRQPETLNQPPGIPAGATTSRPNLAVVGRDDLMSQVNVNAAHMNIVGDAANEPTIVVDPTAPNRISIGWRQFDTVTSNFRQAGRAWSNDGGRTWTFPGVLTPGTFRSDPVMDANANGVFYYLDITQDFTSWVFKSTNGGQTWGPPINAIGGDKEWFAVDRSNSTGRGFIYEIWQTCCGQFPNMNFTRSIDGAQTWMTPVSIPGPPIFGTVAVGPDGEVYVAGIDFSSGLFRVDKSINARNPAATPTFTTSTVNLGEFNLPGGAQDPNPDGLEGQVWVDVDRSNGPRRGWVYLLCTAHITGSVDPEDIMFSRSTDGGATWSTPIRVNNDPANANSYQWFGTLSVAPGGRLDAIWNDTRDSHNVNISRLYYASSNDGGVTWQGNTPLTAPYNTSVGYPQQNKIGDYYHMRSDDVGAFVAFAATLNNEEDVFFLRINDYDCNQNGIPDAADLASGVLHDCNGNGIPDECEIAAGVPVPCFNACYANCDASTTPPILNVNDFICFQTAFAAGQSYANCDNSTTPPVLNVNDFICFQAAFAAGCP